MSKKPVNLALHKSQIERKRRKDIRRDMTKAASSINDNANIVAYAIVGMSDDGRCFAAWDTGGVLPMWGFPETVKGIIDQDMRDSNVDEDFKRPLIDQAWKGSK